ncbi:hypothetical protein C4568_00350 [Candidatus Parcubacteria bacterium]|nr:MAG: hypothetical protein C4568_00350 [Candidatus Parcubacteria bacterium]
MDLFSALIREQLEEEKEMFRTVLTSAALLALLCGCVAQGNVGARGMIAPAGPMAGAPYPNGGPPPQRQRVRSGHVPSGVAGEAGVWVEVGGKRPSVTPPGMMLVKGKPGDPGCGPSPTGGLRCPNRWVPTHGPSAVGPEPMDAY